jgi:hypothetical protein
MNRFTVQNGHVINKRSRQDVENSDESFADKKDNKNYPI